MRRDLYVGSLPFETTEEDLRRIFSVAGDVQSVHIITDRDSGKSKGCGYVKMATESEAKEAINSLDGATIEHRIIAVSEAREQKPVKNRAGFGAFAAKKRRPADNFKK